MSKKILQLCLSPNLGGLELYMQRLSLFLGGNSDTYICTAQNSRLFAEGFKDNKHLRLRPSKWKNLASNVVTLARYIDQQQIDCVHMHWTKDLPLCVFAIKLSKRKPKLIQTRHMNMTRFKSDFYHRFLYRNIDLMIAVTKEVKAQIEHFVPQSICPKVVVSYIGSPKYAGLDEEKYSALRKQYHLTDKFVVCLAGRIEPAKGQALLIEALEQLDNPNIRLLFIGDAMQHEYLLALQQSIEDKGLSEQVTFTGFVDNVQDLMAVSDCVVLATDKETFGMVLVEAMHTGTAVIATDNGGPLEIIQPTENGLLFAANKKDSLAAQIKQYLDDPDLKKALGAAAKQHALDVFESDKQFNRIKDILLQRM